MKRGLIGVKEMAKKRKREAKEEPWRRPPREGK
jgi:hypothetical protein